MTSVKDGCFYSCWLEWDASDISWKWSGCVPEWDPEVFLKDPCCHSGEFLHKWPCNIPNTWSRWKRSYSTDYFSLTAGDNEVKIVSLWTLQGTEEEVRGTSLFFGTSLVLAVECCDVPSVVCMRSEHRLMALWFKATRWPCKMKWTVLEEMSAQRRVSLTCRRPWMCKMCMCDPSNRRAVSLYKKRLFPRLLCYALRMKYMVCCSGTKFSLWYIS